MLTLTGAGGSGKTRLALEAARRARPAYPDGVWFVDLAVVGESLLVADAVSEALRLDSGAAPNRGQALVDQLRGRSLLVVLDNCEHLLAACAQLVAALLAGCPGVDVLATSREPLHAHGEYTFRVPSLALPPPVRDEVPDLAELGRLPSVRLFVERAAQVRPGFALDADNVQGVVDLCRRLDGMPLALELAAARTAVLEPAEIVQRLGDALSMLGGGPNGVTRHQTLRGTLEWSHDLLTEPEKVLLRRLSVFSGGFTLAAVEAVCGDPPLARPELLDLLATLVDKSLVVTEKTAAGSRYRQLETVRQFGSENLDRAGETAQLAAAHCAYFLAFAVAHNPERATGVVIEQPKLLDREHDNLRAALRWSCAHDPETALRLAASLWRFWFLRGHAVEGARWVERALAVAPEPTRPRAAALIGLTGLDSRQGRADRHRALGAEAMAIVRQIGEPDEVVMARIVETALAWSTFDLDEAEQMAAEVRAEAIERGRPAHAAAGSWLLGQCALSREDGPLAAGRFEHLPDRARAVRPQHAAVPAGDHAEHAAGPDRRTPGALRRGDLAVGAAGRRRPGRRVCAVRDRLRGPALGGSAVGDLRRRRLGRAVHRAGGRPGSGAGAAPARLHPPRLRQLPGGRRGPVLARDLRLGLGDRRGELLTEINIALLHAMAGDIDRGLAERAALPVRVRVRRRPGGDGCDLDRPGSGRTVLRRDPGGAGDVRAGRGEARPVAAARGLAAVDGGRVVVRAGRSAPSGARDRHRGRSIFDRTRCVIAGQRLAALRGRDRAAGDGG